MQTKSIHHGSHVDFSVENYTLLDVIDMENKGYMMYIERGGVPCEKVGQCSHCGARLRYAGILAHTPSGERIMVGEDCLNNRFSGTQVQFASLRKAAAEASALSRTLGKAEAFLRDHDDFRTLVADTDLHRTYGEFVADVVSKLMKYGSLSPAQVAAVRRSVARSNEFKARRATDAATLSPAPTGRVTFSGTVLSTKAQESAYGITMKMLVMADGNYKVWCSVPSALDGIKKGERVTLTVSLERSDKDATFAFGKRPTVAK